MAEQLHISVSTVKRALHELLDAGFIQKEARFREKNRGQTSNLYTLVFREEAHPPDNDNSTVNNSDFIDTPAASAEPMQGGYQPAYISFETIAQPTAEQKQTEETPAMKSVHEIPSGLSRTPVHAEIPYKLVPNHLLSMSENWQTIFPVDGGGVHFDTSLNYST